MTAEPKIINNKIFQNQLTNLRFVVQKLGKRYLKLLFELMSKQLNKT